MRRTSSLMIALLFAIPVGMVDAAEPSGASDDLEPGPLPDDMDPACEAKPDACVSTELHQEPDELPPENRFVDLFTNADVPSEPEVMVPAHNCAVPSLDCVLDPNDPPGAPSTPSGPTSGTTGVSYSYSSYAHDPEGDVIDYQFAWGDGSYSYRSGYNSGNSASASHSWSSGGTYCVQTRATDSHGDTGPWSGCRYVSITQGDSYEPDDGFSQYTSVSVSSGLSSQTRSLEPSGDNDYIRFYGYSGRTYIFYSTGSTDTYGHLYNSGQSQLTSNDDGGSGTNFHISYDVTNSGYHYLRIRGYSSSTTGDYTLYYEYDTTVTNSAPNQPGTPTGPSSVDTGVSASYCASATDPDGDNVRYRFLWGDGTASTTTGYVSSGSSACASHSWSSAGSNCVQARAEDAGGLTSTYSGCKSVTVSTPSGDAYEPDDGFSQYTSVSVSSGLSSQTRSLDPAGDEDYLRFYGYSGRTYIFYSTGSTDTYGHLYNSGQSQLTSNDDGGSGTNFHISYDVTSSGYHYLRIRGYSSSTTGDYTLYYEYDTTPVGNSAPNACFSKSTSGLSMTVNAACSSDPDGDTLTYTWNFGDGSTGSGSSVTHHYKARSRGSSGGLPAYTVSLTVSDGSLTDATTQSAAVGPTDDELATYWAPIFYHDTAYGMNQADEDFKVAYDEMIRADFDFGVGQDPNHPRWKMNDNWENAEVGDHDGAVYYHIAETTSEYYIGYAVFHPRDFGNDLVASDSFEHENDMETVWIMVQKTTADPYGRFLGALTMAHNELNAYRQEQTGTYCGSSSPVLSYGVRSGHDNGDISFDCWDGGKHIRLGIEHGGHGIFKYNWDGDVGDPRKNYPIWEGSSSTGDFRGGDGNIYYPDTYGERPGDYSGQGSLDRARGDDRFVRYNLIPIDPLWDIRYTVDDTSPDYDSDSTYHHWGGFYGRDGGNHKAHAPWAIFDGQYDSGREEGIWFEHPQVLFGMYFSGFPSTNYDGETLYANSGDYVYRSTGGVAESFHAYGSDSDYDGTVMLWQWTKPGATRGRVEFGLVDLVDPGDSLEIRAGSGGTWVDATSNGYSSWIYDDEIWIRTNYDGDGTLGWGWVVNRIEWQ